MRRMWPLGGLVITLACTGVGEQALVEDREQIPAEWTIAEDTAATGEVTTASLQLPIARDIAGLTDDGAPRLILRCLGGKVQAFIDTGSTDEPDSSSTLPPVAIALDSAPSCE